MIYLISIFHCKRGPWTAQEDLIILERSLSFGTRWAKIAIDLPGRNENSVKNRFFSLIKGKESKKNVKNRIFANNNPVMIGQINEKIFNLRSQPKTNVYPLQEKEVKPSIHKEFHNEKQTERMELINNVDETSSYSEKLFDSSLFEYENYYLYLQFIESNVASQYGDLENQFLDLKNEIKKINQRNLNLSHLHSSDTENIESEEEFFLDESRQKSNSFISLEGFSSNEEEEELQKKWFQEQI